MRQQNGAGPSAAVSLALRVAARDLLLAGEAAGETGSEKIILARTLADHLAALDAAARDSGRIEPAMLMAIAGDLADLRAGGDVGEFERGLRDALAPMTQNAEPPPGPAGWFEPGPADVTDEPLVRWASGLEITDPLRDAITRLDERLRTARAWVAYRPAARRSAALLREAAGPFERRPAWLTADARGDLEARLVEAIAALLGEGRADVARDRAGPLRRLARLSRLINLSGRLDDTAAGVREIRGGLMDLLKVAEPGPSEDRRLATLERALRLSRDRRDLESEAGVIRQLKPAARALTPAARQSEAAMLAAIPRLLTSDGADTDPAVLNAISAHQRRVDDLRLVVDLNGLIAVPTTLPPGELHAPTVATEFHGLADWVFQAGQDLVKPGRRDLAVAELREVAGGAVEVLGAPGLAALRALADPLPVATGPSRQVWQELTGDRTALIAQAAARARADLVAAWTAKDVPKRREAERRARRIIRVVEALGDAVWSRSLLQAQQSGLAIPDTANLQQWPGWQLSQGTLEALGEGLPAAARLAVDRLLAGGEGETESAVRVLEARYGAVLAAGRLQRLASEAGLRSARPGPGPVLLELGLGPPDPVDAWMVAERHDLAAICRYGEEWSAAARDPQQQDRARAVRAYLDGLAARALDRIRAAE